MKLQVIIHGDDFGRSHARTVAIDTLIRGGGGYSENHPYS